MAKPIEKRYDLFRGRNLFADVLYKGRNTLYILRKMQPQKGRKPRRVTRKPRIGPLVTRGLVPMKRCLHWRMDCMPSW